MTSFEKLQHHIGRTLRVLQYFFLMQETLPHVMVQLTREQTRAISPQVRQWIEFCREIYNMPDLGSRGPDPMPVDPDCPPHLLSDHTKARIGKNHPFFDFVNAPFTHPIGTEISVISISAAWNAYDTFINETTNGIRTAFPDHPKIQSLKHLEAESKTRMSSDDKLHHLGIGPLDDDFGQAERESGKNHFSPALANQLLIAGKDIRTTYTHRLGEPTDRLRKMTQDQPFESLGFRYTSEGFEVTLYASRNILEVIMLKAVIIAAKARGFGTAE